MSPPAVTSMLPPLPQPASALQPAPEAMKDPASRLTVCADTVTEPAFPDPELTALMLLGTGPASPVESRTSLPPALTMTLPPLPHPELAVQLALDEMTAPASRLMSCAATVTEPASPEPMLDPLIPLASIVSVPARIWTPLALPRPIGSLT